VHRRATKRSKTQAQEESSKLFYMVSHLNSSVSARRPLASATRPGDPSERLSQMDPRVSLALARG
jgi:hypothetical protein